MLRLGFYMIFIRGKGKIRKYLIIIMYNCKIYMLNKAIMKFYILNKYNDMLYEKEIKCHICSLSNL